MGKNSHSLFLEDVLQSLRTPSHLSLPTRSRTLYQKERHPQGKGNGLLLPLASQEALGTQSIRTCERLCGLLKYYHREAA